MLENSDIQDKKEKFLTELFDKPINLSSFSSSVINSFTLLTAVALALLLSSE